MSTFIGRLFMEEHSDQYLHDLRHSAAHLIAHAVLELFPGTKLTIGPVTENGFFYDFLPSQNFKEEDLPRIEERMHEIAKRNLKIIGRHVSKAEAREVFKDNKFKLELIDGIDSDTVGIYRQGDWDDLCRGGHLESTGQVKHFKLMSISGAYWRADRSGTALQRITGIAFATKKDLDDYLQRLEDLKMYDHRRLGKQLDLFSFHDEAPGMPFFHHKGMLVYQGLIDFMRRLQRAEYQEIRAPLILDEQLWKQSGHYDFYKENMFFTNIEDRSYGLRPMNCVCSALVYKERPHSYRELPMRIAEFGHVHRYELSGTLHGLFRVRTFTQDDTHIYCTLEQVEDEITKLLVLAQYVYTTFGFDKVSMALSTRPEKFMGTIEAWDQATEALKKAFERAGILYKVQEGDGAFYGPKIDMKIHDAMGREWQCGTIQVDFNLANNFDLEYIEADQSRKRPIVIHRAILGSIERFFGILLEHHKGHLPFWLTPVQVRVLMITDHQREYATQIHKKLFDYGLRAELDESGDQISAQIRRAQLEKIPWMVVIGKKEQEQGTVTLRYVDGKQEFGLTMEQLCAKADELNHDKA